MTEKTSGFFIEHFPKKQIKHLQQATLKPLPKKNEISKVDFLTMVNELDEMVEISWEQIARSSDLAKMYPIKKAQEKKWLCHQNEQNS